MKKIPSLILLLLGFTGISHGQIITTIAGTDSSGYNGDNIPATTARLLNPSLLAIDGMGNVIIADSYGQRIRKVNVFGVITTIAGTGTSGYNGDNIPATSAQLGTPVGVAFDRAGNLYIADCYNHRIRKVNTLGFITTIAGTGVPGYSGDNASATAAELNIPHGVIVDTSDNVYVADYGNGCIRKISSTGIITTFAGPGISGPGDGGPATAAIIAKPYGLALDNLGNFFIAEDLGNRIRKIDYAGIITTVAGKNHGATTEGIQATDAGIGPQTGIAIDVNGSLYLSELDNNRVRKVTPDGIITTIAGTGTPGFSGDGGPAIAAELHGPVGLAVNAAGELYFSDFFNSRIRHIESSVFVNAVNNANPELIIYPNPSSGNFTVTVSSQVNSALSFFLTNIAGEKILEINGRTNSPSIFRLREPKGMYFLIAKTSEGTICQKLILRAESP